jgi:hypothetical protein
MADINRMKKLEWVKKFDAIASGDWEYMDFDTLNRAWETLDRFAKYRIKEWMMYNAYLDVEPYTHNSLPYMWEQCKHRREHIIQLWRKVFYPLTEENKISLLETIKQKSCKSQQIGA